MGNLLSVKKLTKNHDHLRALKGVNLDVAAGEIVGLLGENGAGKSTFLSILGGWDRPGGGTITLDGKKYAPHTPEEAVLAGVGSIRQKFKVDPKLTVAQAIFRSTEHADESEDALVERAQELLSEIGLEVDPRTEMGKLVRAEQALVEVVRMQAENTRLVLMDEVAATFNDYEIYQLHEVTRKLAAEGRAVIYITHRIDEIRSLADRAVILSEGAINTEITPGTMTAEDIAFKMFNRKIEMGGRPGEVAVKDAKLVVENLTSAQGSLNNVTFSVGRGEIFGLTGLRRSGINEVASALVGIDETAKFGTLKIDGKDVTISSPAESVAHGIGYLSDDDDELGLANERSIAKTLMENAGLKQQPEGFLHEVSALREVAEQIQKLRIKTTNIQGEVGKLSGGDQQKVALARWITTDCEILILNHPTRGIDVSAKSEIYKMLVELTEKGTSIILIGSDMSELIGLCNRIAVMRSGELVSVQQNKSATEDTLMGEALGDDVA
ncbi:sugar ABC transporter ATP-binding protein [Rothia nasisuis]|uniref:sugar ABC transporter ATP-binding protein n=1 Tax=Rothia nasisuis TaxID=2109647 RepID=UPI001F4317A7|nr:sugar ABC transporter ATP-binding protein [Rothia nasisuis]